MPHYKVTYRSEGRVFTIDCHTAEPFNLTYVEQLVPLPIGTFQVLSAVTILPPRKPPLQRWLDRHLPGFPRLKGVHRGYNAEGTPD